MIIYPKDLWQLPPLADRSKSAIYRLYARAKRWNGKKPHQLLTLRELAYYLGVEEKDLLTKRSFPNTPPQVTESQ